MPHTNPEWEHSTWYPSLVADNPGGGDYPCLNCSHAECTAARMNGWPVRVLGTNDLIQLHREHMLRRQVPFTGLTPGAEAPEEQEVAVNMPRKISMDGLNAMGVKLVERQLYRHELVGALDDIASMREPQAQHAGLWPAIFQYAIPRGIGLLVNRHKKVPNWPGQVAMLNTREDDSKRMVDVTDLKKVTPKDLRIERFLKFDPTDSGRLIRHYTLRTGECVKCSQAHAYSMTDLILYGAGFVKSADPNGMRIIQSYLKDQSLPTAVDELRILDEQGVRGDLEWYGPGMLGICRGCSSRRCHICEASVCTDGMTVFQIVKSGQHGFCGVCAPKKFTGQIERPTKRPALVKLAKIL